jgi:hypothetical protein
LIASPSVLRLSLTDQKCRERSETDIKSLRTLALFYRPGDTLFVEEQDEEKQLLVSEQWIRGPVFYGEINVKFLLLCSIVTVVE